MLLVRIEPAKPDHDRRWFECASCRHTESMVAKFSPSARAAGNAE